MGVVGRLDQYASMLASEFDDYSMSENLVSYSTYNSSTWGSYFPANATITTGISAPDGTSTAIRFTCTATGSSLLRVLFPAFTPNGTDTYTTSFYVRLISGTTGGLSSDLNDGAPNGSYLSSLVSNQWVRVSFSGVPTATSKSFIDLLSDSTNNYVLDFWGVQVEKGSVATDYTPTIGATISRILPATTNTNITGLGTYYSSGFDENVGFTTFLPANIFAPYDLVYDDFGGTLFGAGQGRYMRQNTDKSVIVYNEIDEVGITSSGVIIPSTTSVNEGSSVIFSVTTTNVENGTTLYYNITGSVGIASTDFTNSSLSGSLVISGTFDLGFGSTTLTLANDTVTEGTETFNMNLRTGSSSGTIIGTSPVITILDTSLDPELFAFTSFTFTTGIATGRSGPTSFASVSSYTTSTWYSSYFSLASGIQSWTVPADGTYTINTVGASGGANNGGAYYPGKPGQGATIQGNFVLTRGTVLNLVVGQKGVYGADGSGGGGGSFVYTGSIGGGGLLIAAGGGGGWGHGSSTYTSGALGGGGSSTTSQVVGTSSPGTAGSKGTGEGGLGGSYNFGSAGGGAGWISDGDRGQGTGSYRSYGGTRWVGGSPDGAGAAGANTGDGGFGGGAGWGGNSGAAGGAGGYSGGGGGEGWNTTSWGAGGGGGSYNSGTSQTNTAGTTGQSSGWSHGSITITKL